MVNMILTVVAVVTLLVWLAQELVGRRAHERRVVEQLQRGATLAPDDVVAEPQWSEWAFRAIIALWFAWLVAAVLFKDGDFAYVLVILTLLAAVIAAFDKWWFARRRRRYVEAQPVAAYLERFDTERAGVVRKHMAQERTVAEYGRSFLPVLAAVLILRSFVVEPFQIPSSSMEPTLMVGDYILVNKFAYGLRLPVLQDKIVPIGEPHRGDVVVFFPPNDKRYFIKRLIGLPGDHIEYHDKVLTINGVRADQTLLEALPPEHPELLIKQEHLGKVTHLIQRDPRIDRGDYSTVVKPGHYFMMGDNRDNSYDSRYWGQVPEKNIVGKAFAIWMHWKSLGEIPTFDRVGVIH